MGGSLFCCCRTLWCLLVICTDFVASKHFIEYEEECHCVTSCQCPPTSHLCIPPRFPDFLGFFKSTLQNFPNLANLTNDLSSKLIKRDCPTFAPLLRTNWKDFDRLICSSLQSALKADVLLKIAIEKTCTSRDADPNWPHPSHERGTKLQEPTDSDHVTLDFSVDSKKRRGGRENDEDYDEDGMDSTEMERVSQLYGYRLVGGLNFHVNRSDFLETNEWDDSINLDEDTDGRSEAYETSYDETNVEYGVEDSGKSLKRSQQNEGSPGGVVLTKQDISLVVILASILLSILLLIIIFYRIKRKQSSIPKQSIPCKKLASQPWYNGTNSYHERETSFIEDRLTRNYKTHPVKRYL